MTESSRSQRTDALVLRVTDYRDADRILTLFTHSLGKVSALARGARGSKQRFAGTLEPYAVISVELDSTRGEVHGLKRAELLRVFPQILSDLGRMDVAGAGLQLLRVAHPSRVADVPMFVNTVQFLSLLDHDPDPDRALLLGFALRVLALSGLSPRLDACGHSNEPVPLSRPAYFDPTVGAVVARRFGGGPFLLPAAARLRLVRAQGDDWLHAARERWDPEDLRTCRAAIAAFVAAHVDPATAHRLFSGQAP